jgi:hypothetical protein
MKTFIRDKDGALYLNDSIRYQKSVLLAPTSNQYPLSIAAAPGAGQRTPSAIVPIEGPAAGFTEVTRLYGLHGSTDNAAVQARLSVEITDTLYRRILMNRDILVNHVFGQRLVPPNVVVTMAAPFQTVESLLLDPQQTLAFQFFNNSTAGASSFRFHLEGRTTESPAWNRSDVQAHLQAARARKPYIYPFWITTDAPVSIPAGGTLTSFMTVTRDIRLVLFACVETSISAGAAGDLNERYTLEILDGQTQRPMSTQPVARTALAGNANVPFWMPSGWMLEPNSKVQLNFTNLVTDAATEVFLTWHGFAQFVG